MMMLLTHPKSLPLPIELHRDKEGLIFLLEYIRKKSPLPYAVLLRHREGPGGWVRKKSLPPYGARFTIGREPEPVYRSFSTGRGGSARNGRACLPNEAVQKVSSTILSIINTVMPDSDPKKGQAASPTKIRHS